MRICANINCKREFVGTTKFCSIPCRPVGVLYKLPENRIWAVMIQRCHNPKNTVFAYYGGSGITVCQKWRDSFEAFLSDVGPRPSDKHSIDRIDNSKGYEPGNCKWSTREEQAANKRPWGSVRHLRAPRQ